MMDEVPESEVSGELARIYSELRTLCAVPYVSSLQRHVATLPGCLEFAWSACRPAFLSGQIQETAWRLAASVPMAPLPKLSPAALSLMGVDSDGVRAIRNICSNFVRVAPINLLFAGVLERLIDGAQPGAREPETSAWTPPQSLPAMPPMRDMAALLPECRAVLMQLSTQLGGRAFVPGLYRLLADWPGYLAHTATLIEPLIRSDRERERRTEIANTIIAAADDVIACLPALSSDVSPPDRTQADAIVSAIHTYRVTSPEMIVIGTLLNNALPEDDAT